MRRRQRRREQRADRHSGNHAGDHDLQVPGAPVAPVGPDGESVLRERGRQDDRGRLQRGHIERQQRQPHHAQAEEAALRQAEQRHRDDGEQIEPGIGDHDARAGGQGGCGSAPRMTWVKAHRPRQRQHRYSAELGIVDHSSKVSGTRVPMKINVERGAFLKALGHVQSVVERRNTIPILSNVLIEAAKGRLKLTATDLDIEIVESMPADVLAERRRDGARAHALRHRAQDARRLAGPGGAGRGRCGPAYRLGGRDTVRACLPAEGRFPADVGRHPAPPLQSGGRPI